MQLCGRRISPESGHRLVLLTHDKDPISLSAPTRAGKRSSACRRLPWSSRLSSGDRSPSLRSSHTSPSYSRMHSRGRAQQRRKPNTRATRAAPEGARGILRCGPRNRANRGPGGRRPAKALGAPKARQGSVFPRGKPILEDKRLPRRAGQGRRAPGSGRTANVVAGLYQRIAGASFAPAIRWSAWGTPAASSAS